MHWFEVFLLIPFPTQNSLPSFCHKALGRRKLLIPPGSILSKICFPQHQKRLEETIICFVKIQSENMTWNIRFLIFCMICNCMILYDLVLTLLLLLYSHDNLILKLHQKKKLPLWRIAFYRRFQNWKCTRNDSK